MMMHLEDETKPSTSYDATAKDGKDAKNGKSPTPANPVAADSATGISILHS